MFQAHLALADTLSTDNNIIHHDNVLFTLCSGLLDNNDQVWVSKGIAHVWATVCFLGAAADMWDHHNSFLVHTTCRTGDQRANLFMVNCRDKLSGLYLQLCYYFAVCVAPSFQADVETTGPFVIHCIYFGLVIVQFVCQLFSDTAAWYNWRKKDKHFQYERLTSGDGESEYLLAHSGNVPDFFHDPVRRSQVYSRFIQDHCFVNNIWLQIVFGFYSDAFSLRGGCFAKKPQLFRSGQTTLLLTFTSETNSSPDGSFLASTNLLVAYPVSVPCILKDKDLSVNYLDTHRGRFLLTQGTCFADGKNLLCLRICTTCAPRTDASISCDVSTNSTMERATHHFSKNPLPPTSPFFDCSIVKAYLDVPTSHSACVNCCFRQEPGLRSEARCCGHFSGRPDPPCSTQPCCKLSQWFSRCSALRFSGC